MFQQSRKYQAKFTAMLGSRDIPMARPICSYSSETGKYIMPNKTVRVGRVVGYAKQTIDRLDHISG